MSPLAPEALGSVCAEEDLPFETTRDLPPLEEVLGQERAVEAIRFGIGIKRKGYNIFALGPAGSGRHTIVKDFLDRQALDEPVPDDWCYVHDFESPRGARALALPAGSGCRLRADMERLVEELRAALPAAFEADEYAHKRAAIEKMVAMEQKEAFQELEAFAEERGIGIGQTPVGFALAPVEGGEVVPPAKLEALPKEEQERIRARLAEVQERLSAMLEKIPRWQKALRARVRDLDRDTSRAAVAHLIDELRAYWHEHPAVLAYLDAVQNDVVENVRDFVSGEDSTPPPFALGEAAPFLRYRVNVLVNRTDEEGAPVVVEDHPSVPNLLGRIEHVTRFGTLATDFTLLRPGALHRANGGYLVLDVLKLVVQPLAWDELKRCLRAGEVRIRGLGELFGVVSTVSLEPAPIPLDVKVVLVGERRLFYLLGQLDPELGEHFKVMADFTDDMARDPESVRLFARMLGTIAEQKELLPLHRGAVALVVDHMARQASHRDRLSTNIRTVADLLVEADHLAREEGAEAIARAHVASARDAAERRADRLRELGQRLIAEGTLVVETEGAAVGQVNALSVLSLGDFSFGRPGRVTAQVRLGKGEVLDIEREVDLGGPLHSKGVLILSAFLGGRFGGEVPLAFHASLVFEQSYGGVDGDSASMAELVALLSALSGVPVVQRLAITGSVDQHGHAQAIGGVNEKIEGFFDVCLARGLTGDQGVLVPATNVPHLLLRSDVVAAVAEGRFHVHPYRHVDEALALLTDTVAGERGAGDRYPEGSVNGRVEARLRTLAEKVRAFGEKGVAGARGGSRAVRRWRASPPRR